MLVRKGTESTPFICGTVGRAPTLRKIFGASRMSSPTRMVVGEAKAAVPVKTVQFSMVRSRFSMPLRASRTILSFRAFTARRSTATGPTLTPKSAPRCARCAAWALATIALVGVQPLLMQVPPKRWRSIIATFHPAPARRVARGGPAWPAPTMIASKVYFIAAPPRKRWRFRVPRCLQEWPREGRGGKQPPALREQQRRRVCPRLRQLLRGCFQ